MSYEKFKLTDDAISTNGVAAAPDKLTGTTQENKAVFDRLIRNVVKELLNGMLAQLDADVGKLETAEGGISAETAAALGLAENATVNEALQRLRYMAESGGIPSAEYVAVADETSQKFGLGGGSNVDAALRKITEIFAGKYYHEFAAEDWSEDGTLTISADVHGFGYVPGATFRPMMLVDGSYRSNVWGAVETWGEMMEDGSAVLHYPSYSSSGGYAGAVIIQI